jgi:hypothetical protein
MTYLASAGSRLKSLVDPNVEHRSSDFPEKVDFYTRFISFKSCTRYCETRITLNNVPLQ